MLKVEETQEQMPPSSVQNQIWGLRERSKLQIVRNSVGSPGEICHTNVTMTVI